MRYIFILSLFFIYSLQAENYTPEESNFVQQRGIELNLINPLRSDSEFQSLSGAFSLFYDHYNSEFRFPLYWAKETTENNKKTIATFDLEYRYYFSEFGVNGYYIGALGRAARLSTTDTATSRVGAGVSFGYRYMTPENWYFGSGINVVNYFTGDNDLFEGNGLQLDFLPEDSQVTIQIDILQIGYRF